MLVQRIALRRRHWQLCLGMRLLVGRCVLLVLVTLPGVLRLRGEHFGLLFLVLVGVDDRPQLPSGPCRTVCQSGLWRWRRVGVV